MIYINNHYTFKPFEDWKLSFEKKNGRKPVYDDFSNHERVRLKHHMLKEQKYICGYCCKSIEYNTSHFEHLKPRSKFRDKTLDYDNIILSCNGYLEDEENCGHFKDDWYDQTLFITPLMPNCETAFEYFENGEIGDKGNQAASTTINKLKLDSSLLNRARNAAIMVSGYFNADFEDNIDDYISQYEEPENGKLQPFCNAILGVMKDAL